MADPLDPCVDVALQEVRAAHLRLNTALAALRLLSQDGADERKLCLAQDRAEESFAWVLLYAERHGWRFPNARK